MNNDYLLLSCIQYQIKYVENIQDHPQKVSFNSKVGERMIIHFWCAVPTVV
jgi:hypothetical protein